MTSWRLQTVRSLAKRITSGGTPSRKNDGYFFGNIPWLNTKEINFNRIFHTENSINEEALRNSSAKMIDANSVIIAMYGATAGKSAVNKIPLTTNQACCNITVDESIADYRFVYYAMVNKYDELIQLATGAAQQNLSVSVIGDFELPTPPLPEQRAIASVLSSLDDKIDLLHRQNKTLEAMAETLFRQWFVEDGSLQSDRRKPGKLGDWINETIGGEWGTETPVDKFTKCVNCIRGTDIADLITGLPVRTPIRFVKDAKFKSIEPQTGDLIIEISGGTEDQSTGRVAYINDQRKALFAYPIVFSNFCRLLRIKDKRYQYFLYCYIMYLYDQDEFFNLENGSSGIKNLDYKALLFEVVYPMPEAKRVLQFNIIVAPFFAKADQNRNQIRTLAFLRNTLLPKLMSGDLKVTN